MTASAPFPLPPGRALSAWRQDLAPYQPRRLCLAHLLLHRVECLVRAGRRRPLDAFRAALLRQLAAAMPLENLRVDRELLGRWMRELTTEGLVQSADGWRLTERGWFALESDSYTVYVEERRVFTFLDGSESGRPPSYLALAGPTLDLAPPPGWRFDAVALEECVRRPEEWKTRHCFPTEVEAILAPRAPSQPSPDAGGWQGRGTAGDWRRVILDRPEQILLVFVTDGAAASKRWLGFAVRPEDWVLQVQAPALTLGEGSEDLLPDLGGEPSPEAWRQAWGEWCQQRGLPAADADGCQVRAEEGRVLAVAPRSLISRLGGDRLDAWLLAGTGRTRVAAPLEIGIDE